MGTRLTSEFHPGTLSIIERPPSWGSRLIILFISGFMLITLSWLSLAHIDIVVTAQGRVVPNGKVKQIQSPEGGIIKEILVRNGQYVVAGEALLKLDNTTTKAELLRVEQESDTLRLEVARLQAQLNRKTQLHFDISNVTQASTIELQQQLLRTAINEHQQHVASLNSDIEQAAIQIDIVASTINKHRSTLPLLQKRLKNLMSLQGKGYVSELDITDAQLALTEQKKDLDIQLNKQLEAISALNSTKKKLNQAVAEFRRQSLIELLEAKSRLRASQQEQKKAKQRELWQIIRAPINGTIQDLSVTTIGGVLTAAQGLMALVPDDIGLEVEAKILNKDIGNLRTGQPVVIKLEPFSFTRHGALQGHIEWIAIDSVANEEMGHIYPVRIALESTQLPNTINGKRGRATPGMAVTVDVAIGSRALIEYFIAPVIRYRDESLREQ